MTLRAARVNKGLTQEEAGKLIGVTKATICSWETYKSYPTVAQLPLIERAYDVKYDDIIFLPTDYTLSVSEENANGQTIEGTE